jgi:hypothetical protein
VLLQVVRAVSEVMRGPHYSSGKASVALYSTSLVYVARACGESKQVPL